jgi:hypothetical protein
MSSKNTPPPLVLTRQRSNHAQINNPKLFKNIKELITHGTLKGRVSNNGSLFINVGSNHSHISFHTGERYNNHAKRWHIKIGNDNYPVSLVPNEKGRYDLFFFYQEKEIQHKQLVI